MRLTLTGIRKSHAGREVLRGCDFEFAGGGMYVLAGDNGSGKSTLLRICALLEEPDSGEAAYFSDNGKPISHDMALRRRITLVLPRGGIFDASVLDNAAYGLRVRGLKGPELVARAEEALSFVGLSAMRGRRAKTLSSGEAQRLAIARAIAIRPEVLFLDEPTASVDRGNTLIIEGIIGRMREAGRTTIVMTTHDAAQAGRLGGVRLELAGGELLRG